MEIYEKEANENDDEKDLPHSVEIESVAQIEHLLVSLDPVDLGSAVKAKRRKAEVAFSLGVPLGSHCERCSASVSQYSRRE